jgi:hypothetical protein
MALGTGTIQGISGAVEDIFSAKGLRAKAEGNRIESQQYDLAAGFSRQNKQFAETSTAIKAMQAQRGVYLTLGQQAADVAASGFESAGSALDLLRDSAAQGALHKAILSQQGLIEEAGYEQQAKSYELMSSASLKAAQANEEAAEGKTWTAAIKGVTAVTSLFT